MRGGRREVRRRNTGWKVAIRGLLGCIGGKGVHEGGSIAYSWRWNENGRRAFVVVVPDAWASEKRRGTLRRTGGKRARKAVKANT